MDVTLPLDQMTISEKLRAIEEIWEDLSRSSNDVPSPAWHADVLRARDERTKNGSAKYVDWAEAKKDIRDSVK
ncbi:MAG: addiction module antitoxin RelB [Spirochaetaceae bacterium]|nr:MAG: addiction module antitoxin RelB [Spirochaetaceae bacterium]